MPAPMIAPTPSAVSCTAPKVRLRLCSPASFDSVSSMLIGFFANNGLPMQLLLGSYSENAAPETTTQFGPRHCRGAACRAPKGKFNYFACSAWPVLRDHSQYTGTPNSTITNPGHAVCVLYNSSTIMIATAATMYNNGPNGYANARYGRSRFGRFARRTKIPAIVRT